VEIEDIMSEVQNSKEAVQSVILMVDDATKSFSTLFHMFLVSIIQAVYWINVIKLKLLNYIVFISNFGFIL
jgi:hypothetical protein